jgi:fumarate hydratase class II
MAITPGTRIERDSMGEMEVPADALWGASTQRAVQNFPISGERLAGALVRALGQVKAAAAVANAELGQLDAQRAEAIRRAADEVAAGELDRHFVVDVFQTGSGTSTHMNANEVIANRARQLLGDGTPVHPNDHVNRSQSSNDAIPTALHVAARQALHDRLLPALARLHAALLRQADAHDDVVKIGRTHLMDATPVRFSQEFRGWARQVELGMARVEAASRELSELALGGTAVGTGINRHPEFPERAIRELSRTTGLEYRPAGDPFEAQGARDAAVAASGALRCLAVSLYKIASDIRLLASGPRCGLAELVLAPLQPGSSIMPGKVNPVVCEVVLQVAVQVVGNDAAVGTAGLSGQLELNAFIPVIARNLLGSIDLLSSATAVFAERCIETLRVDRARAESLVEGSLALATALVPAIGYEAAAEIAGEAARSGRTIREVCRERRVLPEAELARLLDPRRQTEPG